MNILIDEHHFILKCLNKEQVNYMLIGGYAVIYYGYERVTGDMDIWLEPSNANKIKFIKALSHFDIDEEGLNQIVQLDFTIPQVFYFGQKPKRIDFLTKVTGVQFEDAIKKVNIIQFDDLNVPIIHYNQLLASKTNTGRMKDLADIEELEKIKKQKDQLGK